MDAGARELSPFFSIIVPTHNRPDALRNSLGSIGAQSCDDYEVIVVDDGSTADNRRGCRETVASFGDRFRLIERDQSGATRGPHAARNTGIRAARGRYIGFLDDDDRWCDERHLEIAKECLAREEFDVYFTNQTAVRGGNTVVSTWLPALRRLAAKRDVTGPDDGVIPVSRDDLCGAGGIGFAHVNITLARRSLVESIGGFWEYTPYEEDLEFYLRLIDAAQRFAYRDADTSIQTLRQDESMAGASDLAGTTKSLLRALVCSRASMSCRTRSVRRYAAQLHSNVHRTAARQHRQARDHQLALEHARQALAISPTLKWAVYCILLAALTAVDRIARRDRSRP